MEGIGIIECGYKYTNHIPFANTQKNMHTITYIYMCRRKNGV